MDAVTRIELFFVPPRWLYLRLETASGLVGWGEPIVEGLAGTVAAAVTEMSEAVIGTDSCRIEHIWQTLYRGMFYRGGPVISSAISGIDQALWDIAGKRHGVPIYHLLGGHVRDRVRVYSHFGGATPEEAAREAKVRVAQGYTALKMGGTGPLEWMETPRHGEELADRLAAVRDAVGSSVAVGIDFHGRVHRTVAKPMLRSLEPYSPAFYEEPVLGENLEALRELADCTCVPIAMGERQFTRWEFKRLFAAGCVDIIQPDLSHAGGISEVRRIAALAEAYDLSVAPHCPLGPIALAASLQLDFATPNAALQEQHVEVHAMENSPLLETLAPDGGFQFEAGFILRSEAPGLGITVNEERVRALAAGGHRWRCPRWQAEDGGFAEW